MPKKIPADYLVFDDDEDTLKQYNINVKIKGYDCNPIHINPTNFLDPSTGEFDEKGFKDEIILKTQGKNITLVLSDWNMSLPNIFGWDIISMSISAKDKLKDKQFLIYSSDIKNASKYILEKISNEVCKKPNSIDDLSLNNFVSNILDLKIKFWKRDGTQYDEIITLLKKESKTISNIVLNSILSLEKKEVVNFGNANFDGKTISEIFNNPEENGIGLYFVKELMDLSLAHYTKINDDVS
ncbi:hypothetical protein [Myroides guanonis]|uniref:Uncharacterized protein n=1 Tax=Myroides guanonis TaxID=1150112 RepID=A0A1I3PN79_9FLAO|nr:hypothetical protein [Myroides guanonis]SFJ22777.1 hypothetical protein SAMN04487893_104182 [Myroides guanonis]